jgi:hypothetical protein
VAASDDFLVEREDLWVAITGAPGIRCSYGESINVRPIERRRIDCGNDVVSEHAGKNICQRDRLGRKWREVEMPFEADARFLRRNDFKELFLARGRTYARNQIAVRCRL